MEATNGAIIIGERDTLHVLREIEGAVTEHWADRVAPLRSGSWELAEPTQAEPAEAPAEPADSAGAPAGPAGSAETPAEPANLAGEPANSAEEPANSADQPVEVPAEVPAEPASRTETPQLDNEAEAPAAPASSAEAPDNVEDVAVQMLGSQSGHVLSMSLDVQASSVALSARREIKALGLNLDPITYAACFSEALRRCRECCNRQCTCAHSLVHAHTRANTHAAMAEDATAASM